MLRTVPTLSLSFLLLAGAACGGGNGAAAGAEEVQQLLAKALTAAMGDCTSVLNPASREQSSANRTSYRFSRTGPSQCVHGATHTSNGFYVHIITEAGGTRLG